MYNILKFINYKTIYPDKHFNKTCHFTTKSFKNVIFEKCFCLFGCLLIDCNFVLVRFCVLHYLYLLNGKKNIYSIYI